jgi:predicted aspartyl protease
MRARPLLLALTAALAAPLAAQTATSVFDATSQPAAPPSQNPDQSGDTVSIRNDAYQRMTVAVRLADAGPFRFLVDTGADRTSISRDLVEMLRLPPGPTANLHSLTGSSQVQTATIEGLRISSVPVSSFEGPVLERRNMGADGILALDSLHSQRVLFDFRSNSMSVLPFRDKHISDEPGTIVIRAKRRNGRLVLSSAHADGVPLTVVVDTGSEVTIGNAALQRRLGRRRPRNPKIIELQSVTGQMLAGESTQLDTLEFGGVQLHELTVVFADAHTFKQLGLEDKPALLLGMNAMRAFDSVLIDFEQKKLRLRVPRGTDRAARGISRHAGPLQKRIGG